jgi:hypothetical protein
MKERRMLQLVTPFYLDMMGRNVSDEQVRLIPELAGVARGTIAEEVIALLRGPWRESCMGAWYSLFHDPKVVGEEVLDALRRSCGVLNACALMVAAVELVGPSAIPAIEVYAENDRANQWGGEGFALAALRHLDHPNENNPPTDSDREEFAALLHFAQKLRSAPDPYPP